VKVRSGFVSNSSSSSFIALFPAEEYEKIRKELSPTTVGVVEAIGLEKTNFMGIDCLKFGYISGNYSTLEYIDKNEIKEKAEEVIEDRKDEYSDDFEETYQEDHIWDATYEFQDKLGKLGPGKVFTHSEDF
jgi:hypothetical protein